MCALLKAHYSNAVLERQRYSFKKVSKYQREECKILLKSKAWNMGDFCCLHSIFEFMFFQQMALRELDRSKYSKYSQGGCCWKGLPQLSKSLILWSRLNFTKCKKVKRRQQLRGTYWLSKHSFRQSYILHLEFWCWGCVLLFSLRRWALQQNFGRQPHPILGRIDVFEAW